MARTQGDDRTTSLGVHGQDRRTTVARLAPLQNKPIHRKHDKQENNAAYKPSIRVVVVHRSRIESVRAGVVIDARQTSLWKR